jgi:secreted trypsin-like serine protease
MVTTLNSYNNSIYSVGNSSSLNGVVRISSNGYYGSGTLLYGGMAVLTAAHLFSSNNASADIVFETSQGRQTVASNAIEFMPLYDTLNDNNDLAIVWLADAAPTNAHRYELFRSSDEIGRLFTAVGYGNIGTGSEGMSSTPPTDILRLKAVNKFETDATALKNILGSSMAWAPQSNAVLAADFDDGTSAHDTFGLLMDDTNLGYGRYEGMIALGDSGGPAFIDGKVAGVASYVASLHDYSANPDINATTDSSFGEVGFWHRVSYYQQWIDESLREHYTNAPKTASEVQKEVVEGASGTAIVNYFLVEVSGMRSDQNAWLSVKYTTRDGTAIANQDYIPSSGTLVLYPDENYAVIPVEVIGDNTAEANETFYLDIFDPVGASFGGNQIMLTAQRIILNDDGYFFS